MQMVACNLTALAVACIYYCWRDYRQHLESRERVMRERVAYMLWVAATSIR